MEISINDVNLPFIFKNVAHTDCVNFNKLLVVISVENHKYIDEYSQIIYYILNLQKLIAIVRDYMKDE